MTNEELYATFKQEPWSEKIKKRRLRFFGHICRLPPNTPARRALNEALKSSKKKRGRQKTTYLSTIEKQLKAANIKNIKQAVVIGRDRKVWRQVVRKKRFW